MLHLSSEGNLTLHIKRTRSPCSTTDIVKSLNVNTNGQPDHQPHAVSNKIISTFALSTKWGPKIKVFWVVTSCSQVEICQPFTLTLMAQTMSSSELNKNTLECVVSHRKDGNPKSLSWEHQIYHTKVRCRNKNIQNKIVNITRTWSYVVNRQGNNWYNTE
jgi:hypothetical protein